MERVLDNYISPLGKYVAEVKRKRKEVESRRLEEEIRALMSGIEMIREMEDKIKELLYYIPRIDDDIPIAAILSILAKIRQEVSKDLETLKNAEV